MTKNIRITLVEDNLDYRDIITLTLGAESDIQLISQFGTSEAALRELKALPKGKTPDLILLDLRLPGMGGLEALPHFREALPDTPVIVLTQSDHETDVLTAISQGAAGYLLKSSTLEKLTEGVRTVMNGGAALDASIASFILKTLQTKLAPQEINNVLTPRELEILTLLSDGLVKKEIADRLNISFATVDTHIRHIYEKLNVQNAPSAVRKAFNLGLFKASDDS
ncbi:MAG: response regulator transcription factor [Opitutae bacterium]|nr:response regulator transcription factor [Opitutae bacterium]